MQTKKRDDQREAEPTDLNSIRQVNQERGGKKRRDMLHHQELPERRGDAANSNENQKARKQRALKWITWQHGDSGL